MSPLICVRNAPYVIMTRYLSLQKQISDRNNIPWQSHHWFPFFHWLSSKQRHVPRKGVLKAYSSAIMDDLASVVANVVERSSWEKSRRGRKCHFPPKGRTSPHIRRCIPWNASRNSKLVLCVQVAIAFIQENLCCSSGVPDCVADTSGAFNEPQEMRQHESQKVQAAQLFTQG